jgi:hypothetical protein
MAVKKQTAGNENRIVEAQACGAPTRSGGCRNLAYGSAPYQKFLKIKPSSIGIVLAHY